MQLPYKPNAVRRGAQPRGVVSPEASSGKTQVENLCYEEGRGS